ncbi:MAG: hypothetical protein EZS28_050452, partial [Streblomastix strix]
MLPVNAGLVKTAHGGLYIDLTDDFTLFDRQKKATKGEYENEKQNVLDLTRLLVYYEGETEDIYAIKGYDAIR